MIDPEALKLFTKEFLEVEMRRHGIEKILAGHFSDDIGELTNSPMFGLPKVKTICIDIDTDWEAARQKLNWPGGNILDFNSRSYATPVILENEQEAKLFIFWHEAKHISDPTAEEWVCDSYARKRILEHRKGL